MFLNRNDYEINIDLSDLDNIIQNNNYILEVAEAEAIDTISNFLSDRYDLTKVFFLIEEYDLNTLYNKGDHVKVESLGITTYYTYINDTGASGTDVSDSTHWKKGDPRNRTIIRYVRDLVLFTLSQKIAISENIQTRFNSYDDVRKELVAIRDGKMSLNGIPTLVDMDGDGIPDTESVNNILPLGKSTHRPINPYY